LTSLAGEGGKLFLRQSCEHIGKKKINSSSAKTRGKGLSKILRKKVYRQACPRKNRHQKTAPRVNALGDHSGRGKKTKKKRGKKSHHTLEKRKE